MKKIHTKQKFLILIGLILVVGGWFLFTNLTGSKNTVADFESRKTMEAAMNFIRAEKPSPPISAIFYAKVAENIYNGTTTDFRKTLDEVLLAEKNLPNVYVKPGNKWNEYWVKTDPENPKTPFSPKISQHPRFNLKDFTYQVPEPPKYMSEEYKQELQKVIDAAQNRTLEQGAIVNFFGGVPGSEQPAGIWQNIYFDYVKNYNQKLSNKILGKQITEKEFVYNQMILAQVLADAFMECWKVKYHYQTKRPDMAADILGQTVDVAMPNPPFGSYVSGHATISFAAATVLTGMFPENSDKFLKQAEDAKNSRLWAGIHFDYDNVEGKKLGIKVGEYYVEKVIAKGF